MSHENEKITSKDVAKTDEMQKKSLGLGAAKYQKQPTSNILNS